MGEEVKAFPFEQINRELLEFLDESPTSFHATEQMSRKLEQAGFIRLREGEHWKLEAGKDYYVTRNSSALIAFKIPCRDFTGFQVMASHSDSPTFKIKANPELSGQNCVRLNVEKYGGMICSTWMDRPLSVAGRLIVKTADGIESRLVKVDRDLLIIPSLAIHMNRSVNEGYEFNAQRDMLPLFSLEREGGNGFLELMANEAGVAKEDILDMDLFLYNRMKGTRLGASGEFLASARLDDLQCAFSSLWGILHAEPKKSVAVHCVMDNEEVGSTTRQGAASTFLKDVLQRISMSMGRSREEHLAAIASSFMLSADNAHAVHPNQPDKADPTNRPALNGGIVIKYSANQKYTTDAVSGAMFRLLCEKAGIPVQTFHNRSDMLGGSTLGNISGTQAPLCTVDIGLAQLAMHSCYETAGSRDTAYLAEAAKTLFSSAVEENEKGAFRLMW